MMIPLWIPISLAAVCFLIAFVITFRDQICSVLSAFRQSWFVLATIVATLYGGTKPNAHLWKFTFGNYISDNGSYCSNDTIHAAWSFNEAYGGYAFRWCYRDLSVTNEVGTCIDEYHYLPDYLVSASNATATVLNATNMEVVCYAQYVAPVHVVTNGTYHVSGVMRTLATTNSASPQYATPGCSINMVDEHGYNNTVTPTNEPPAVSGTMTIYQTEEE